MRKAISSITSGVMAMLVGISSADACELTVSDDSPFGLRVRSEPVTVDNQCRTNNIGVGDHLSLGQAQDLGNGRISQSISDRRFSQVAGHSDTRVFLADCNTREATILLGPVANEHDFGCGPTYDFEPLIGPAAAIDLTTGDDLHQLTEVAEAAGARELNPLEIFFKFNISVSSRGFDDVYDVGRKDRFNLLCGCDRFYPNSAGASQ